MRVLVFFNDYGNKVYSRPVHRYSDLHLNESYSEIGFKS